MKRFGIFLLAAACAATEPPPDPLDVAFARETLRRPAAAEPAPAESPAAEPFVLPPHAPGDEIAGILVAAPGDPAPDAPLTREELATLAWRRAPAVAEARARYEAARTAYAQSKDLADLVALYRSFQRGTVAPDGRLPVSPGVEAISGEIAQRTVAIAFEELRRTVRDTVAAAEEAHADAARISAARRILRADVALQEALLAVVRARFEAGDVSQAGALAFEARLESLRTELAVLDRETAVVRARWNRLLGRPEDAPVHLDVAPGGPEPAPVEAGVETAASQEVRIAALAAERAELAVRLAETMTLPRMVVAAGPPRYDFGVRESQVQEMRARAEAASRAREAARDAAQTRVREALFAVDRAARRWRVHDEDLVPLAERSFEAERGAYESGRAGYIELLDAARRLLAARLGRIDARRDHAHARAGLLRARGVREGS